MGQGEISPKNEFLGVFERFGGLWGAFLGDLGLIFHFGAEFLPKTKRSQENYCRNRKWTDFCDVKFPKSQFWQPQIFGFPPKVPLDFLLCIFGDDYRDFRL